MISPVFVDDEGPLDSKIVFVGEAPGATEEAEGRPFIGESGNLLITCLGRNGVRREDVRLANLCHYRPPNNDFRALIGTSQFVDGITRLENYLKAHRPNVVVALGNWPLYLLTGRQSKKAGEGIGLWRGSILSCNVKGLEGLKVIPTYHPAYVTRDRSVYPTFDIDIKRAIQDSSFPDLRLPQRKFIIDPHGLELEEIVLRYSNAPKLAVDIETFGNRLACVGFAISRDEATCIVWREDDNQVRVAIERLLTSGAEKIFHFGIFDTTFLSAICGFEVSNYKHDTMVTQHVMWPELPRSLAYLTSVYTREPYYKAEGKASSDGDTKSWGAKTDKTRLWMYNCKDCTATYEIHEAQDHELAEGHPAWRKFVNFEIAVQEAASAISKAGMLVNEARRKTLERAIANEWRDYQFDLDTLAGRAINVNSSPQVRGLIYDELKLPVRRNRKGDVTSDDDALVSLLAFAKSKVDSLVRDASKRDWQRRFIIVKLIRNIRGVRKLLSSYILAKRSADGRFRSIYKVPGAETGRWSAEKYVDKTGVNSMTFPREGVEVEEDELKAERSDDQGSVEVREGLLSGLDDGGSEGDDDSGGDEIL